MMSGTIFRFPLSGGTEPPQTYFKAQDRYRDLAISPDGRRIYAVDRRARPRSDGDRRADGRARAPGRAARVHVRGSDRKLPLERSETSGRRRDRLESIGHPTGGLMAKLWLLAVAVVTATFSAPAAAQGRLPRANATANPQCVTRSSVRRMQIVDANNILFVMRDKTTYRNSLARQCPGLRRNSQITLTPADGRVCAGANFQVLLRVGTGSNSESVLLPGGQTMSVPRPSFVPGPACTLGAFAAITEADAEALVESSKARRRDEPSGNDEAGRAATRCARGALTLAVSLYLRSQHGAFVHGRDRALIHAEPPSLILRAERRRRLAPFR